MRSRISVRDLTATVLVVVAAAVYALVEFGVDVPGLGSTRTVAAIIFGLGILACSVGADPESFYVGTADNWSKAAMTAGGAAALGLGIAAMVTASSEMVTALLTAIVVLWLATTARHATPAAPGPGTRTDDRPRALSGR